MMATAEAWIFLHRLDTTRLFLAEKVHFNANILAEEFDISPRTAKRYLKLLRNYYGILMEYDSSDRTYFLIDPGNDHTLRHLLKTKDNK
jgi:predicted DNA-binding transcriptional regulator YafY